jgi:AraC-like DNA-binding protein
MNREHILSGLSQLISRYEGHFPGFLTFYANSGVLEEGSPLPPLPQTTWVKQSIQTAIRDAYKFGEATLCYCSEGMLLFAVPTMINQKLLGGIVVFIREHELFWPDGNQPRFDFRLARAHLQKAMIELNLTNGAALSENHRHHLGECKRADAIFNSKVSAQTTDIRRLYLTEEPALFAAIHQRDLPRARQILNGILLVIHQISGDHLPLAKGFFLELVVSIHRRAIEGGADPNELLGENDLAMESLRKVNDLESLTHWLVHTLETLLHSISQSHTEKSDSLLEKTLAYLEQHLHEPISRDEVALKMGLSPNHFSTVLHRKAGTTFSELINRMRIDAAATLLRQTDQPLSTIAQEVGFSEQSYFTKIFKKQRGITPLKYRHAG